VLEPDVRRVVVGLSGSLANRAALRAGASLARRCGTALVVVYVRSPMDDYATAEQHVGAVLLETPLPDVDVDVRVLDGDVASALTGFASGAGDVLVVGTGRQRRLRRWRTGAVHRSCLANARCLVLTVPPPLMLSEAPRALTA
jgi:nucleotide-binding universal stress UspA family protein